MFNKILIATDLSECSLPALHAGLTLARRLEAAVVVVYVSEPAYGSRGWFTPMAGNEVEMILGWTRREEEAARTRLEKQIKEAGHVAGDALQLELRIVTGVPHDAILDEATRCGADLLVVGSHGRRGIQHALLGSVAERLVRLAAIPVLTTRHVTAK